MGVGKVGNMEVALVVASPGGPTTFDGLCMSRVEGVKVGALIACALGAIVVALVFGPLDVERLRSRIDGAGVWGAAVFLVLYAAMALIPVPKAVLTAAGGALFGLWAGAVLSLAGALVGAIISFGVGRLLGRGSVERLVHGRLAHIDALLTDHGLSAVLLVRLVSVVPFTTTNYACGVLGIRFSHYVLGSVIGMVPGTLAYTALASSSAC